MSAPVLLDLMRRATWPPAVAARLDLFERLPSHGLHPDRNAPGLAPTALAAFGAAGVALWHRHRSRTLRAEHPVLARPLPSALPAALLRLMLLEPAALCRVARAGGVTLLAPGIGATIARDAVASLRHALGEPLYQFAIHVAAAHHPGLAVSREWAAGRGIREDLQEDRREDRGGDSAAGVEQRAAAAAAALRLVARVEPLGWSLIDAALDAADPGVLARVALKRAPAAAGRPVAADEYRIATGGDARDGDTRNGDTRNGDTRDGDIRDGDALDGNARHGRDRVVPGHPDALDAAPPLALTARDALALTDTLIAHFEPAWFSSCNAIR